METQLRKKKMERFDNSQQRVYAACANYEESCNVLARLATVDLSDVRHTTAASKHLEARAELLAAKAEARAVWNDLDNVDRSYL